MARTQAGAALTDEHRRRQVAIRARALQEFLTLAPIWRLADRDSFDTLVSATIPMVAARHGTSAAVAADYWERFRVAENVDGSAVATVAAPVDRDRVAAGLYSTGQAQARQSLAAGMAAEQVRTTALATMTGSVTRLVMDGGRQTVLESTVSDGEAVSWMRVTSGSPCAFCAMLASRGPAYTSKEAAGGVVGRRGGKLRGSRQIGESYHDNCVCTLEPYYEGSRMPAASQRWRDLWNDAQRDAKEAGELKRGTKNDALNAFRRVLDRELTTAT